MSWTDTHCHVNDDKFAADRVDALTRAQSVGVQTFIEIAESTATWQAAVELAGTHPFVYASLGIHPHHAHEVSSSNWPEIRKQLKDLLQHPKVQAVGEFGLDYYRMQNSKEEQLFLFRAQLDLALELNRPVVIHCRDAHADTQTVLSEYYGKTGARINGVIHCFSGSWDDAQVYLPLGFMFGVDGPITYPSAQVLRDAIRQAPLERLVLETDSPYLPPQTHRGQRNEPLHIPAIGQAIADLRGITADDVAKATTANAKTLFRLN